MESSQASVYHEKLQLNGSENFPGELQITLPSWVQGELLRRAINSSPSKSKPYKIHSDATSILKIGYSLVLLTSFCEGWNATSLAMRWGLVSLHLTTFNFCSPRWRSNSTPSWAVSNWYNFCSGNLGRIHKKLTIVRNIFCWFHSQFVRLTPPFNILNPQSLIQFFSLVRGGGILILFLDKVCSLRCESETPAHIKGFFSKNKTKQNV